MGKKATNPTVQKAKPSVSLALDSTKMKKHLSSGYDQEQWGHFTSANIIKLYYNKSDKKEIYIDVKCHNFVSSSKKLKFKWACYRLNENCVPPMASSLKVAEQDDKSPYIVVKAPESEIGNKFQIVVTAYYEGDIELKNGVSGVIVVQPLVVTKEISDKISWSYLYNSQWNTLQDKFFKVIRASITLNGYNNQTITVARYAKYNGKEILNTLDELVVKGTQIDIKYNRSEIASYVDAGDTVELICRVGKGSESKTFSKKLTMPKSDPVEPIKGTVSQPAVTGRVEIEDNNFKICKYTKIEAKYTKDGKGEETGTFTLFQEGSKVDPQPINLIGGKRKVDIILSDYTIDKCDGAHKNKKAILSGYNIPREGLGIDIVGGKISKEFEYQYKLLTSICVWPIGQDSSQQYNLRIATCRYTNYILINHYPDVKWALNFKCEMLEKKQKGDKRKFKFELSANHSYDDFELEGSISNSESPTITIKGGAKSLSISNGIQKSFRAYIEDIIYNNLKIYSDLIKSTVEFVDTFKELFDQASDEFKAKYVTGNALNKTYEKDFPKQRKTVSMEIILPKFEIGLEWEPTTYNNKIGMLAKGRGKGTVIGGQMTLDLLAILGKLGGAGVKAFLATIDFTLWLFDAEVKLDLVFKLELSLEGEFSYNGAKQDTGGSVKAIGTPGVSIKGEFTYKASENVVIKTADGKEIKQKRDVEKGYGIKGEGKFPITLEVIPTPKGYDGVLSGNFDGLKITCYVKVIVRDRQKTTISKSKNESEIKGEWVIIDPKPLFNKKQFNLLMK